MGKHTNRNQSSSFDSNPDVDFQKVIDQITGGVHNLRDLQEKLMLKLEDPMPVKSRTTMTEKGLAKLTLLTDHTVRLEFTPSLHPDAFDTLQLSFE